MKKMILVIITFIASLSFMITSNAEVNQYLLDYATKSHKILGEDVTLPNSEIVKVERFLSQNTITDDEALNVINKLEAIKEIINNEGIKDITKLSKSKKQEIMILAEEAASIVGATISYDNTEKVIAIYKDGIMIENVSLSPYLKQTGTSNNEIILYSLMAVCFIGILGTCFRKSRNA